jgi:hypothetical protein
LGQLDGSLTDLGAPLFSHLLTGLMWTFGASDIAARLVSVLAGVALALTPLLLARTIGTPAALCAAFLLATSPIAVELSREVDPAMLSTVLVMTTVASAIRVATDRPAWAPWALAASLGLGLACHSSFLIGIGTACLAAYATWGQIPRMPAPPVRRTAAGDQRAASDSLDEAQEPDERLGGARGAGETWQRVGAIALAVGAAVFGATGLLMDLVGLGFLFGGIWAGALQLLAPTGFPSRGLAVMLADAGLLLILGIAGFVLAMRRGDRIGAFLGQWALLLLILSAGFGSVGTAGMALYLGPLAILGGQAVARAAPWRAVGQVTGAGWAALVVTMTLGGLVLILLGASLGGGRTLTILAWLGVVGVVGLMIYLWERVERSRERVAAAITLAAIVFLATTVGTVIRVSFGGSPAGTEPLTPIQTHPAFREAFRELNVLARADQSRAIVYDATTPLVARWYGRSIPQVAEPGSLAMRAIAFRTAPQAPPQPTLTRTGPVRVPLQTLAQVDPAALNPMGLARWAISRTGLVQARGQDIMIVR